MNEMITNSELLEKIHTYYGKSLGWESDLAKELRIPISKASLLVHEAGYFRHKIVKNVPLDSFTTSPYASFLIKKNKWTVIEES